MRKPSPEYLTAAAEDPLPNVLLAALSDVAKARGMATVAKAGVWDVKAFTKRWRRVRALRHETVNAVLRALGVRFSIVPDKESA